MGAIADTLEQMEEQRSVRRSRWPFTFELFDPERDYVRIGWLLYMPCITVLRIKWPLFHWGTMITNSAQERVIIIYLCGREFMMER